MKLSEQHIFKGYWWLPDKPEEKVAGILTYTPGERILLELIGGFKSEDEALFGSLDDENQNVPLIYGVDSNAKEISLVSCSRSFSYNFSSEFPITRYTVQMLVHDKHIKGLDEVCDYTAHIRFPELSYWAHPSAIRQVLHYTAEGKEIESCTFHLPHFNSSTEIITSVDCDNGVKLSINRCIGYQSGELMLKPEIEQFSSLEIKKPSSGISIKDIFHEVHKFSQFLSLVTKRNVRPESIYLIDPDIRQDFKDGSKSYFFPISFLLVQSPVPNPAKLDCNKFLFRYEDLADKIPELLVKWMSDTDNLLPIKNHLVDSLVYKPIVGSVDFLQVIQAIEGVWWRFRDDTYKATLPQKQRKRQTSLKTIILELLSSFSAIPTIAKMEIDVDSVVDSRVYYTHFVDKAGRPKLQDGWDLYELTKKLRMILLCLVLGFLGLDNDEIESILAQQR